ncbi:hypothetical protein [Sphaerothrix gracilis]
MDSCCNAETESPLGTCPQDGSQGKPVKLITLKSLLTPESLADLDAQQDY